uniref:Serine hydrolase n=1 Tax=Strongyloides venezuelensis TaxID=75913 RepID=A0A0K0F958_STRVS
MTPLSNLLESLGEYAKPQDEIQFGRDKSISILGMPIGKKDGLSLSPTTGMSYGKKSMFGPIAVNDHYNVKWDFFDKFKSIIQDTSSSFGLDTMLAKTMYAGKYKKI